MRSDCDHSWITTEIFPPRVLFFFLFLMSSMTTASWPRFGVYCGTSPRSSGKVSSRPVEGEKTNSLSQSEIKRSATDNKTCNPRHAYDLQKHHCPLTQKERESSTMLPRLLNRSSIMLGEVTALQCFCHAQR